VFNQSNAYDCNAPKRIIIQRRGIGIARCSIARLAGRDAGHTKSAFPPCFIADTSYVLQQIALATAAMRPTGCLNLS
jgi:hypothetical protein